MFTTILSLLVLLITLGSFLLIHKQIYKLEDIDRRCELYRELNESLKKRINKLLSQLKEEDNEKDTISNNRL